VFFSVGKVARA